MQATLVVCKGQLAAAKSVRQFLLCSLQQQQEMLARSVAALEAMLGSEQPAPPPPPLSGRWHHIMFSPSPSTLRLSMRRIVHL